MFINGEIREVKIKEGVFINEVAVIVGKLILWLKLYQDILIRNALGVHEQKFSETHVKITVKKQNLV